MEEESSQAIVPAASDTEPAVSPKRNIRDRISEGAKFVGAKAHRIFEEPKIEPLTAGTILGKAGITDVESYYSGDTAMAQVVGSDHLEKIFELVRVNYGEAAAMDYARMVSDSPSLAAINLIFHT